MRLTPITIAILASCVAFNIHAADNSNDLCSLLDLQDFQSVGVAKDTSLISMGWNQAETPKEIPDSKLWSNICTASIMSKEGGTYVALGFDGFEGNVTVQQVSDWLKSVASSDTKQTEAAIVKVDDASCESGQYDLPAKQADGSSSNTVVHYVACDRQVDTRHISLNVGVPEGKKDVLPSPEQTKALLDKSIARMKQLVIAAPANL